MSIKTISILPYICCNGHTGKISYHKFSLGGRCRKCYIERRKENFNIVKEEFIRRNCILLDEYKNNYTKLKYKCSKGHINFIMWRNFKRGQGCKKCSIESSKGENSPNWNGETSFGCYPVLLLRN